MKEYEKLDKCQKRAKIGDFSADNTEFLDSRNRTECMKEYEKLELEKWERLAEVCIVRKNLKCRITDNKCKIDKCVFYQWIPSKPWWYSIPCN